MAHVDRRDCEFSFSGLKTAANMVIAEIDSAGACIVASDAAYYHFLIIILFLVQRVGIAACLLPIARMWLHPFKRLCFIISWPEHTGASSFPVPTGPTSSTW